MQSPSFFDAIAFLGCAAVACAGAAGCAAARPVAMSATTTAGEVPPTAREASLPPTAAAEGSEAEEAPPPGRLICRTKSVTEGTSELYLDWDGPTAKGFVRRVAPSGMIYVERVRAERYKDAIIVDEPSSVDLVTHAAVVGRQDGKQYMRVGDRHQPWVPCE